EAKKALAAFFQMIADRQRLPKMTWKFKPDTGSGASVEVKLSQPALAFRLWTANSSDRDFRDDSWSSVDLHPDSLTRAMAKVQTPEQGFRAYLVEAELKSSTGELYRLSTEARVTPDGLPGAPGKYGRSGGQKQTAARAQ
ncbi:MAG: PhoPQ-activated protein PqaA family protein, partial [Limisphaerales bacterium]